MTLVSLIIHSLAPRQPYSFPSDQHTYLRHDSHSRLLHLVIPNSLLITRWSRVTRSRFRLRRRLRLHKALLLIRELRVGCAIHRAILRLALRLDVVVSYVSALGIFQLRVRWLGRDGDDVPGVQEAREEAEA